MLKLRKHIYWYFKLYFCMKKLIIKLFEYIPCSDWIYNKYLLFKGRQRKVCLGSKNADKTFYVIGWNDEGGGLFWIVNKVCMHIAYALDHGYIPVVDLKNYITQYSLKNESKNVWEIFFEQPAGYGLEDIKNSKNVIINRMTPAPAKKYLMGQTEFYDNPERIAYFRNIFKTFIHPNNKTLDYIRSKEKQLFKDKERVLGILCRGTDYVVAKPKNHPIQPEMKEIIKDAKEVMKEKQCNYVFLATEDKDILDVLKAEFGNKLLFLDQRRYSSKDMQSDQLLAQIKAKDKERNPIKDALDYYAAIYLLTRCCCFIGGRTGGTKGVLLMNNGFEYKKIYDLGLYK